MQVRKEERRCDCVSSSTECCNMCKSVAVSDLRSGTQVLLPVGENVGKSERFEACEDQIGRRGAPRVLLCKNHKRGVFLLPIHVAKLSGLGLVCLFDVD